MKIVKWIHYTKVVQGRICAQDYVPVTEDTKYILSWDDETLRGEAESWAENVDSCGRYTSFDCSYEFVDAPPQEWIDKKKSTLRYSIDFSKDLLSTLEQIKLQAAL